MATPITLTIGTDISRDYISLSDLVSDIGVGLTNDLVASDEVWTIIVYNDSSAAISDAFFTIAPTTDATRNITVTAAAGHSFVDNFTETTPLFPDAAQGAQLQVLSGWGAYITPNCHITFKRLVLVSSSLLINNNNSGTSASTIEFDQCILRTVGTGSQRLLNISAANQTTITRSLLISESTAFQCVTGYVGGTIKRCTLVCPSAGNTSFGIDYVAIPWNTTGTAVFNFGTDFASGSTGNYNASSDLTAPGANSLHSLVLANEFENAANDFRKKLGSSLIDAGNVSGLLADVRDVAIPQNGIEDIGADEYYVSAPVGNNLLLLINNSMGC